jgi:hypothetical protein
VELSELLKSGGCSVELSDSGAGSNPAEMASFDDGGRSVECAILGVFRR